MSESSIKNLNLFLKNNGKFILHYFSPQHTGKASTIKKSLKQFKYQQKNEQAILFVKDIWLDTGSIQSNMVIEHLPTLVGADGLGLSDNLLEDMSNVKNIYIFINDLRKELFKFQENIQEVKNWKNDRLDNFFKEIINNSKDLEFVKKKSGELAHKIKYEFIAFHFIFVQAEKIVSDFDKQDNATEKNLLEDKFVSDVKTILQCYKEYEKTLGKFTVLKDIIKNFVEKSNFDGNDVFLNEESKKQIIIDSKKLIEQIMVCTKHFFKIHNKANKIETLCDIKQAVINMREDELKIEANKNEIIEALESLMIDLGCPTVYTLVVNHTENILSSTNPFQKTDWKKEVLKQWQLFLKCLIELNSDKFFLKIILIINDEYILNLDEIEEYTIHQEHDSRSMVNEKDSDFEVKKRKIENSIEFFKGKIFNEWKSDETIESFRLINNVKDCIDKFKDEYSQELKDILSSPISDLGPEKEKFSLQDLMYHAGYKQEVLEIVDHSVWIEEKHSAIKSFIGGMSNSERDHRENLKVIKDVFFLYSIVESIFQKSQKNISKNYKKLIEILNEEIGRGKPFSDVGDLFRTYGYSTLLLEMIDKIKQGYFLQEKKNDECASVWMEGRIHVLEGNIYYYNYPENYSRSLKCYLKVIEMKEALKKTSEGRKVLCLAIYDSISLLYQLIVRNWKTYISIKQQEDLLVIFNKILSNKFSREELNLNQGECTIKLFWEMLDLLEKESLKEDFFKLRLIVAYLKFIKSRDIECRRNKEIFKKDNTLKKVEELLDKDILKEFFKVEVLRDNFLSFDVDKVENICTQAHRNEKRKLLSIVQKKGITDDYWKSSVEYHLIKLLVKTTKMTLFSMKNKEKIQSNKEYLLKFFKLLNEACSEGIKPLKEHHDKKVSSRFGETTWKLAKLEELTGDIHGLELFLTNADEQEEVNKISESIIASYLEAERKYLVLNGGYQVEKILEKIEDVRSRIKNENYVL